MRLTNHSHPRHDPFLAFAHLAIWFLIWKAAFSIAGEVNPGRSNLPRHTMFAGWSSDTQGLREGLLCMKAQSHVLYLTVQSADHIRVVICRQERGEVRAC